MTAPELRAALVAAFPPTPITRAAIHTPDARWSNYENRDALALLVGAAWTELAPEVLERHDTLLVHAGGELFRAVLPGYLALLAEREYHTALPFFVAGQLTRKDSAVDRKIFDERVEPMTPAQRAAVRSAIAFLAARAPMQDSMSAASRSW
jgi:hypothetical protein